MGDLLALYEDMLNAAKLYNIPAGTIFSQYKNALTKAPINNSLRSWDHCRLAFLRAAHKRYPGVLLSPTLSEDCENPVCHRDCQNLNGNLCDNALALHLMAYLASWGMYRSSFLKQYDYTIHIGAVQILMQQKYLCLFDPNLWSTNRADYILHVTEVYTDLLTYYRERCSAVGKKISYNNGVSDTLITKILMGVYGCIPAYDTYFKKGIRRYGMTTKITLKNIRTVLEELCDIATVLNPFITSTLSSNPAKAAWNPCGLYTPMKLIDMIFWSIRK